MDPLVAYAFRSAPPADMVGFRRLAQLGGQLGAVTALCFLLCPPPSQDEPELSVRYFLFHTVPRLLPQLSRATQPQRVLLYGRADGRIDWSSTFKARYSEEGNPAIFVCQQSGRRYNRLENQLFKFLLRKIQACLDRVLPDLHTWSAWGPARHVLGGQPLHVGTELAAFAHRVRRYQTSIYLHEVDLPAAIGGKHLLAARTAKNQLYTQVANLYEFYMEVVEISEWSRWVEALNRTAPLPHHVDEVARLLLSTT